MKDKLTIVKLGGNCMDDEKAMQLFLEGFAAIEGKKILVHGGGKLATRIAEQLGVQSKMIDGRRVTDEHMLDVTIMVYTGLINRKIVAALQTLQVNAIGFSGADGNLIRSGKRSAVPVDYGFVGDPTEVNTSLLEMLLGKNIVPVISPITHDGKGQLLNTNADTVASVIASALSLHLDVHLIFAFDKKGVLENVADENSVIRKLSAQQLLTLQQDGKIHSGMLPKLKAGFDALNGNVSNVTIAHLHALQSNCSTQLVS